MGGHILYAWDGELIDVKDRKRNHTVVLDGNRSMTVHTTTNQKTMDVAEGIGKRLHNRRKAWGQCNTIVLRATYV
jgi:hypothetical protein